MVRNSNGYKKISNGADTEKVSFVSAVFLQWMNIIFKTGSERALEEDDFLPLSEENTSCSVVEKLQEKWNKEKAKCKENGRDPKLWKSVIAMISVKEIMVLVSISGLYSVSRILQPLFLGYLIVSLMSAESEHNYLLYGCALAMGINALIGCLSMHYCEYRSELWGIRISTALKGLVYLKVSTTILVAAVLRSS